MISEFVYRIMVSVGWLTFIVNLIFVTIRTGVLPNTHGQHVRWRYVIIYAPMGIILYFGIIAYTFFPSWIAVTSIPLPDWVRLLSACVAYCGLVFALWGYAAIGRNWGRGVSGVRDDVNTLVTTGPYALVRNPIYAGIMIFLVCIGITAANVLTVIPSLVLDAFVIATVPEEERALIGKFGQPYLDYMERVPRFIPKVHRQQNRGSGKLLSGAREDRSESGLATFPLWVCSDLSHRRVDACVGRVQRSPGRRGIQR